MNPNMDRGDRQKRIEACRNALPPDYQAALWLLEPGKRPLSVAAWHDLFARSATLFLGLPDPLRELCPAPSLPELLPERLGSRAFLGRKDLEACAGAPPFARADLDRLQPWHHLGALLPVGWRGPVRSRPPGPLGEAVEAEALALPAAGDALAAPLARGKKRHPRRHPPNASSLFPLPHPEGALAWSPTCQPPASVAASDASHSLRPIGGHAGHHTTGSRSSRHTTTCSIFAAMAHAACHDHAWVGQGERQLQTSAILNHSRLHICLPCLPSSVKRGQYSTKIILVG